MRRSGGFSLIEILISAAIVAIAAMAAVAFLTRTAGHATWAKDRVFAREKALSIIAELRAFVEGGDGQVAADLDDFDDGPATNPTLTITPDPSDTGALVQPNNPISGNIFESGRWRWYRQISVRPFGGEDSRDLRACTVRMYRLRAAEQPPGTIMAEVSTIIRTIGEAFPSTQVYDLYLLALENVPGWWVDMGAMQPFIESTLRDLETRNPGLKFRTHWITTLGYGRDEEYAPFTNDAQESIDDTPWAYVYPGTMPAASSTSFYYVPARIRGRVNVDGIASADFANDLAYQEPFVDTNGNGVRDPGETYVDENGNDDWDLGNEVPYAVADMHNHCMRYTEAEARFNARVNAALDEDTTPTWRLLLDRMVANPDRFHNAILVNLHGELLPMPPTRNFSDAASNPELRPGWRVVAHPERINTRRVPGDDVASDTPRFRVYAYKTAFPAGHEPLMTQQEPFLDADKSGTYDPGEAFQDWNGNGAWDAGLPLTLVVPGGDFSANPNGAVNPSLLVERLPGGIDADATGGADTYATGFEQATRYPESFTDANGDGVRQVTEAFLDLDGDGARSAAEPYQELDGDGQFGATTETLDDGNGNGVLDLARPAEAFVDANGNGTWDAEEPYWDRDGNGVRDGPTASPAPPWQPWDPAAFGNTAAEDAYVANFGEPFLDRDGDQSFDAAETFFDSNGNGVRDGGFARGEMWYAVAHIGATNETVLYLHGTPLETPDVAGSGLDPQWRLYDLDYIPCPTPAVADGSGDPFARNLATVGNVPKNTARWRLTLPLPAVRRAFETSPGAADGDAGDRVIRLDARIGTDLGTGVLWPVWNEPRNLSAAYTWFCDSPDDLPFSERYQMRGDPRHSPYEDTARQGSTAANGYNWYFDDFSDGSGNFQGQWPAFDPARLRDGWLGRTDHDVGRMMQWLRRAVVGSEAIYTTLTGFSYYYLSVGGDVGYDSANGYPNSIPMDGKPFGLAGDVNESTITSLGTSSIRGSRKFVRSNAGAAAGVRAGGLWWSKPFLGELCPDDAYASQWKPWGNVRAALSSGTTEYRLMRRSAAEPSQLPRGTTLINSIARLSQEGCTSFFNIGTSGSTFHHQFEGGRTGDLVGAGVDLATGYGYPIPATADISRPFSLASSGSGGVGDEFPFTDAFPRFSAELATTFYDHERGTIGSGLVRLQEPGPNPRGGYVVVNGLDKTVDSGTSFIARYSIVSLLHGFFEAGLPGSPNRVMQLPQVEITWPTLVTELISPASINLTWEANWARWDGQPYTGAYTAGFTESENELVYVLLYSRDNGKTWLNILDESPAQLGHLPLDANGDPDPARTRGDLSAGAEETFNWSTPADRFPKGSYKIRIEAHRRSEQNHYAMHMEKIYVDR